MSILANNLPILPKPYKTISTGLSGLDTGIPINPFNSFLMKSSRPSMDCFKFEKNEHFIANSPTSISQSFISRLLIILIIG